MHSWYTCSVPSVAEVGCWSIVNSSAGTCSLTVILLTVLPTPLFNTKTQVQKVSEGGKCGGVRSDLNFLTIHGKSRFPGLHVWLRDGTRAAVKVPQGCLFIQVIPATPPDAWSTLLHAYKQ